MKLLDYCIGNLAIIFCDAPYIYIWCSISKITKGVDEASTGAIIEFIVIIVSIFIVVGVAYYVYKVAQAEADKIMEFRKSSALARKTKSRISSHHHEEE
jgi:phosphate/sulfate permease